MPLLGPTWAPKSPPTALRGPLSAPKVAQDAPPTPLGKVLGPFWAFSGHFLADVLGWSRANAFAENLVEPLLANDPAQNLCSIQPLRHRAECGACHLGSARCPGGTQSACEPTCTYLNLGLHFSALHFCISPLGVHFSQHFTSCTYFIFLHFTPCTYFPARHFTSCTHFSVLPPFFQRFSP